MRGRRYCAASAALSASGAAVSTYLLNPEAVAGLGFCEIGSWLSCNTVLSSPYASILGVPTASYGVLWFAVAFLLSLFSLRIEKAQTMLLAWSIVWLIAAATLTAVEVFLIRAVCLLCTTAHILGAGVFSSAYLTRHSA